MAGNDMEKKDSEPDRIDLWFIVKLEGEREGEGRELKSF